MNKKKGLIRREILGTRLVGQVSQLMALPDLINYNVDFSISKHKMTSGSPGLCP